MDKFQISKMKTLKLQNVLIIDNTINDDQEFNRNVCLMEQYIKTKGALPIGPLIQYVSPNISQDGKVNLDIKLLYQANTFIHHVEKPYTMEAKMRINNCVYIRYHGPENQLQFAYQKLNLIAFEEDICLKGDSYTVFVDNKEGIITADVFMERANDE